MTAKIIDGKLKASTIKDNLKTKLADEGVTPSLATIIVGDDPASKVYLSLKKKACAEVGLKPKQIELTADTTLDDVLDVIHELNEDNEVDGILVQLPLPPQLDTYQILTAINPKKDVDGFHPVNIGRLAHGDESFAPATPKGIVSLLEDVTDLEGKNVVIINHSIVIGKPLALMLLARNATVSVCHVHTKNLSEYTLHADIIISAAGVPGLIREDMVPKDAIVIDAGVAKTEEGILGDVDFEAVKKKASAITPVPGGVGPMTVAMLLTNTVNAAI